MYVTAMVSIPKTQRVALSLPLLLTVWLALSGLVLAVGGCLGGDPPPPDFPPPPPPTAQTPPPRQDLPVIVPVPEPSQDCDEPLHEPSPDAAPEPEPWPEPSPDAGVPDAAPLPPDAAPEPVGPCEWVMDSTELVAPGAAWMFGYFPEATIASEGGLVIGRSNVPEQGSN